MSGVWRAVTEEEGYSQRNGDEHEKAGDVLVTYSGDGESCAQIISWRVDTVIMYISCSSANGRGMQHDVDVIRSPQSTLLCEDVKFTRHLIFTQDRCI